MVEGDIINTQCVTANIYMHYWYDENTGLIINYTDVYMHVFFCVGTWFIILFEIIRYLNN